MTHIVVVVVTMPPSVADMIVLLHDDLHPSHSIIHMSFPEAGHMHDNLYLHVTQIDKMSNIS